MADDRRMLTPDRRQGWRCEAHDEITTSLGRIDGRGEMIAADISEIKQSIRGLQINGAAKNGAEKVRRKQGWEFYILVTALGTVLALIIQKFLPAILTAIASGLRP